MSTDELTGVQALERKHPGLPLAPGKVERREFEYIRHGTRSFIFSRDVVTGQVQALVQTTPEVKRWHIVCDRLNTHQSASLVAWVAKLGPGPGGQRRKRDSGIDGQPSCVPG